MEENDIYERERPYKPRTRLLCLEQVPEENPLRSSRDKEGSQNHETAYHLYYKSKGFENFHYVIKLAEECSARVQKVIEGFVKETSISSDVMVKLRFVGKVTEDNLKHVTHRKGKEKFPKDHEVWKASPLICFQNDLSFDSAKKLLSIEKACHKILVISNSNGQEKFDQEKNILIVDYDHIREAIIRCLEKPVQDLLDKWVLSINSEDKLEEFSLIRTYIENIRKQLLCEEHKLDNVPLSSNVGLKGIIPEDIKKYLSGLQSVNSFGIWDNSTLKVFVKKETNQKVFHDELKTINTEFFSKYILDVEAREFNVKKFTIRQGDTILACPRPDDNDDYKMGTIGGFVTKMDDTDAKYALTCEHVIPFEHELAFSDTPKRHIGDCVFKSKESDFAAIEIRKSISDECDTTFRRDDNKNTNARVYNDDIGKLGTVYKIGGASNLTKGSIKSPEFWFNSPDDNGKLHRVFLVHGGDDVFSHYGDSGSLVFSRPRRGSHSYVNVVGMVSGVDRDDEKISCCYPLPQAIRSLEDSLDLQVKFKDDVPLSSSPSSSSSSSSSSPLSPLSSPSPSLSLSSTAHKQPENRFKHCK
uniref:Uncharacterized protein LOC111117795 n=1 Tax=Crassostrea virginica TaxID=6565 RepID=A0A8B8CAE9_CRAVI|nr:uncharacterized protein LOC111117795 [Crassostrea virginica]